MASGKLAWMGLSVEHSKISEDELAELVSDAAHPTDEAPHGTALLPSDLTNDQLADAPVLASIDALVIEDLSDDEDDTFAAALGS